MNQVSVNKIEVEHVFIIHVSKNNEERKAFIKNQMANANIDFEFMLAGDMDEITHHFFDKTFTGEVAENGITPAVSCATKHLLVCKEIIKRNLPLALVFEDDIILKENFNSVFNKTIQEIKERAEIDQETVVVSYENTGFEYVAKKDQQKGVYLYPNNRLRCAGAYLITNKIAQLIIDRVEKEKCHLTIDWFIQDTLNKHDIPVYWCHPAIAEQGSHNGKLESLIDNRNKSFIRKLSWKTQNFFKKRFRSSNN